MNWEGAEGDFGCKFHVTMGVFQSFLQLAGGDPANLSFVIFAVKETVNQHPH